jgi:hypothetical protein
LPTVAVHSVKPPGFVAIRFATGWLPDETTDLPTNLLKSRLAGEVRLDMLGRGFALVETPSFFDDVLFLRLTRQRTVLRFHSKRWWKYPQLARYACWLERLLHEALPEEGVSLLSLEFRHEPEGFEDPEVDGLHADGSYIRSVFTPYGMSTIYFDVPAELSVPDGHTLLMTAQDRTRARRIPCTLHRRPGAGPERAVIVGSFEPRRDDGMQANVHRQAAGQKRRKQPRWSDDPLP